MSDGAAAADTNNEPRQPTQSPQPEGAAPAADGKSAAAAAAPPPPGGLMGLLIREHWTDGTLLGLKDDLLAGFTVAVALIPQSIAFAVLAKMNPKFGLFCTFYIGIIMSVFGARSGAIYGAAAAIAVEYPHLVETNGPGLVLAATIGSGVFLLLPAIFQVTDYIRMLPNSIMVGFVDGLAVLIFRGTLINFEDPDGNYITGMMAFYTCLIMFIMLIIIWTLPLATKAVPSIIIAVIVGTAIEHIFKLGTWTVGDKYSVAGALEAPAIPEIHGGGWGGEFGHIVLYSLIFAIIGGIESLLMQILLDKINGNKSSMTRELVVYGIAHIFTGFFGGFAGCAIVGQTILNVISFGGKRRVSGVIVCLLTLIVIYVAAPAIEIIPLGALSAVTFTMSIRTFDWNTFIHFWRLPYSDSCVIVAVVVTAFFTDLAVGVAAGLGVALLLTAFRLRENVVVTPGREVIVIPATEGSESVAHPEYRVIELHASGVLFFASAPYFLGSMERLGQRLRDELNVTDVVFDMEFCEIKDFAAIESLEALAEFLIKYFHLRMHIVNLGRSESTLRKTKAYLQHVVRSDDKWASRIRAQLVDPTSLTKDTHHTLVFPFSVAGAHLPPVPEPAEGEKQQPMPLVAACAFRRCTELGILLPVGFIGRTAPYEPIDERPLSPVAHEESLEEALDGKDPEASLVVGAVNGPEDEVGEVEAAHDVEPLLAMGNERRLTTGLEPVPGEVVLRFDKEADALKHVGADAIAFAKESICVHYGCEFVDEETLKQRQQAQLEAAAEEADTNKDKKKTTGRDDGEGGDEEEGEELIPVNGGSREPFDADRADDKSKEAKSNKSSEERDEVRLVAEEDKDSADTAATPPAAKEEGSSDSKDDE